MTALLNQTKLVVSLLLLLAFVTLGVTQVFAQNAGGGAPTGPQSVFGTVAEPPGVASYNAQAGGGIGLINFISAMIRILTIVAGLYVFLNLITAGYDYISAGDAKAHQAVKDKVTMSILGLVIIVASYTLIALVSLILFQDPTFIINPKIIGPNPIIYG